MAENPNLLLQGLFRPFYQIFSKNMMFLMDRRGEIREILSRGQAFETVASYLREQKNVFKVFDMGKHVDIQGASESGGGYPILRNIPYYYEYSGDFHTSFALLLLEIVGKTGELYLGVVKPVDVLPNIHYSSSNLFLYVDGKGGLKGFNQNLFSIFSGDFNDPANLFDIPVERIISPSPMTMENDYFLRLPVSQKPEESIDLCSLDSGCLASYRGRLNREDGSLRWSNDQENNDFIHFPFPVDTACRDFQFSFTAEALSGSAPLVILGRPKTDLRDPDYDGYLAGENAGRTGYIMKKRGFVMRHGIIPVAGSTKSTYALIKRGRSLALRVDGKEAVRFWDPDFIHHREAVLCLALRPGGRAVIDKARLEFGPTVDKEPPFSRTDRIVRIQCKAPMYFSLTEFHNLVLNSMVPPVTGYILSDVTQLTEKVERYKEQYEAAKKKQSELSLLLDEYKAGRQDGRALFIGSGPAISRIREQAQIVAGAPAPVLIQGATGTGKEVLARFIHDQSPRQDKPFIKVDCSTLPKEIIESELFGHEKGAFTGAVDRKIGRFEQASGGTLFLDEVANLNREIQSKLLSVLQDHAITRVGGRELVQLDIRILAASNMDLEALTATGAFREDLLFRLNAITINLPGLAERREDLPELCRYFISLFNQANNKAIKGLTPEAYKVLLAYSWPGNIRELRNVIQAAVIFCGRDHITPEQLKLPSAPGRRLQRGSGKESYHLRGMTRARLAEAARRHQGRVSDIARELMISRQACYDNFSKYGINISRFREIK